MRVEMGQNDGHMLHPGWVVAKEIAEVNKMLGCGVPGSGGQDKGDCFFLSGVSWLAT